MRASDRFDVPGATCRLADRVLPVRNLSVGGVFVEDEGTPPPPGQFVEVELRLGRRAPFRLVGKVVWRREREGDQAGGFGLQITRIEMRDKLALIDCLRRQPA